MQPATRRVAAALTRLESDLAARRPAAEVATLGEPAFLDFLFQVLARRLIRLGPEAAAASGLFPAQLPARAEGLAAAGALPASTAAEIRHWLAELARAVHAAGAWRADRELWWQPTPGPGALERLRQALDAPPGGRAVPSVDTLASAFGDGVERRWLEVPGVLPAAVCTALHPELEAAFGAGELQLEAGGVGAAGRISSTRADAVAYLDGFEPELVERLPRLAVLVQWCLADLAPRLAERLPVPAHPPVAAMLARYPGPSGGYRAHLDNPGGAADNGRELAVVVYLNPPERRCVGGELELWRAGAAPEPPADERLAPGAGAAALLDARAVAHRVLPLGEGPARWSLVLWLNRSPQVGFTAPAPPPLSLTEVLLPVASPPLPPGRLLFHELDGPDLSGRLVVRSTPTPGREEASTARRAPGTAAAAAFRRPSPRSGIVATVYGAGEELERWCRHHLGLGFDHLVVVFDRLEEEAEGELARRLQRSFPRSRLTVWSGSRLARERWPRATADDRALRRHARGGAAPQAVAARQTLNASAALAAAATDELGGAPLDWLLHLDADELFCFEGAARGGAGPGEHFASLAAAGIGVARYLDHELLLAGAAGARLRFKRNPRLAAARLGPAGFAELERSLRMRPSDPRPYFTGYVNGKSAVAVAAGRAAAGVHGWRVAPGTAARVLAGPSVLHLRFASADGYCRKYLAMADAPDDRGAGGQALFEPCQAETEARELTRSLRRGGASEEEIRERLLDLRHRLTAFGDAEVELLEAAGLLFEPALEQGGGAGGGPRKRRPAPRRASPPSASGRSPSSVGVLGGGTAGYLAALALRRRHPEIDVTLLESPSIPVIGVGEATTPLLPQFLHVDLGLEVRDFFAALRPTLKLGIRFDWAAGGGELFNYPFGDVHPLPASVYDGHLRCCSRRSMEMDAGVAPPLPDTETAYHLDNRRLVGYLRKRAESGGVRRIGCTVSRVETAPDRSRVEALVTDDGRRFAFDLYVDASGFRSLLLGEALATPFVDYSASLFTDRALVAAAPHGGRVRPYTRAEKMAAGWCWTTPQRHADHLGYVYSSSFAGEDEAEAELRARHPGVGEIRSVRFTTGRRDGFWRGNVVALGNAYAFVEPLESTALHMLVRQIGALVQALPLGRGCSSRIAALNRRVNAHWDYLSWFLALHYRFDDAPATPFWKACAREVDVSRHGELIEAFRARGPLAGNGASDAAFDYPDPLWGPAGIDLLLIGQRVPARLPRPATAPESWRHRVDRWRRRVEHSPPHADLLAALDRRPELLERYAESLRQAGAAYPVADALDRGPPPADRAAATGSSSSTPARMIKRAGQASAMSSSIERILREVRIRELPRRRVSIVAPATSLSEVYRLLDEEHSVAVLVCDAEGLAGIFTERDILNRTALEGDPGRPIGELMSPIKASLTSDDRLADAIRLMRETGFRHIPLVEDGGAEPGLIGGRDILTLIAGYYPETLINLPPRLHQQMTRPEGG